MTIVSTDPEPTGDEGTITVLDPSRPPMAALMTRIGVEVEPGLFQRALTHRSFAYENGGLPTN